MHIALHSPGATVRAEIAAYDRRKILKRAVEVERRRAKTHHGLEPEDLAAGGEG